MDVEASRKEQEQKESELNKWLEDWEKNRFRNKEQERSNLVSTLGRPGSNISKKREQEHPRKPGKTKKLKFQPIEDDWGETAPPALVGGWELGETVPPSLAGVKILDTSLDSAHNLVDISTIHTPPTTTTPSTTTHPPETCPEVTKWRQASMLGYLTSRTTVTYASPAQALTLHPVAPHPVSTSAVEATTFEENVHPEPLLENPHTQGETVEGLPCSNAGSAQGVDVGTPSSRPTQQHTTPSMVETAAGNNLESCSFKRGVSVTSIRLLEQRTLEKPKVGNREKMGHLVT